MKKNGFTAGIIILALLCGLLMTGAPRARAADSYAFTQINGPYGGSIRVITLSPSFENDGRVAVGTSNGLFLSKNRGATFSVVNSGLQDHSQSITAAAFSPNYLRDRLILVGTEDGLYRSDDGGASFSFSNRGLQGDGYTTAIACSPTIKEDNTVFAASYLSGAWKSTDAGRSWVLAASQLKDQNVVAIGVSPSFATDHTVLFGVETAPGIGGAWISTDGGVSAQALPIVSEDTGNAVAFSPAFASDHTFAVGLGADGCFLTTDGGATFKQVYGGIVTSLLFAPSYATTHQLFIGTSGKGLQLLNTADASVTLATMPASPQSYGIPSLAASPAFAQDGVLFAGTSRLGLLVSKDSGKTLADSSTGITNSRVNAVAVSPSFGTDHTVFFGTAYQGVARTFDGGKTVTYCDNGLGDDSVLQVVLSPSFGTDHTVAAGTDGGGLYLSNDRGDSWSAAGPFAGAAIPWVTFAPDYASSGTAFISVEGQGIWETRDRFADFQQLATLSSGANMADKVVDCIALSPGFATDRTLYVATHSGRLYESTDAGASFVYLAGTGLPRYAVKELRTSPDFVHDKTLYLCTDYGTSSTKEAGVYKTTDGGKTWTQVQPYTWYDALRISDGYAADGTVLAVSWGGGLDVTTDRGLVFGSVSSGIPLVSGKYWGNALDISPTFSRDGVAYIGLTNGGVYTTYDFQSTPEPPQQKTVTIQLTIDSPTMLVNGAAQQLDAAPMIKDGRTLVPIRAVVEAIGGSVAFDAKDGKGRVDIVLKSTTLSLWIDATTARLNGKDVPIDSSNSKVTPIIQSSRTYLPFRFVGESLGCTVNWDAASLTVTLTYAP